MELKLYLISLTFVNGILGHAMPWALAEGDYDESYEYGEYDEQDCSEFETENFRYVKCQSN